MNENSLKLPTCLLVDDLEENLIALKALMKDEKVEIFTARSGNEALELLLKHDFAFAMLDVQMPEMNGFELAEIMRSTERTRHVPIIFVTAAGSDAQRVFQGYDAGAVDFLHKPLAPKIVLGKIRIFLELYQQRFLLEEKIQTLKKTESELNRALLSRDEFMSICSHELKTPLTSLKMQLQIVDRVREKHGDEAAFSTERMNRFLSQADKSADRLIHLVNDMLDISRVATGRLSLNVENHDICNLIHEVVDRLSPLMDMANCPVEFELPDSLICAMDRYRIEQVLTNLLTNAAKYAPEKLVLIKVQKQDEEVEVAIQDHGPGISDEDQRRIFERFERASDQNSISGLGLGLYISKEILELHQGRITVSSVPGKGSIFTFYLPLANAP